MRVINMKPLLLVALGLILSINALPENIEDVKELPQAKEIQLEAEESEPQARSERCTDCSINFDANGEPLAAFKALPGAIVHTQEIIEECSSANGCAGLKIKDGRVIQKFGDLNAFNAASAADFANEFQFQAADIGGSGNVPFWWMNKDSPFKASGGGGFEKLSQASFTSSSVGSAGIRGAGLAGAGIGGAGLAGAGLGGAGLGGAGLGSAGLGVSGLGAAGIGNTAYGTSGIASTGLGGAGFGSTGLGATGLGAGGLGSTRLGGVGYGSAGVGATGLAAGGLGSTRLGSAGYGSSGVGATGLGTGGLGSAGFGSAGIGATGIGSGGLGNTRLGGAAIGGNGFGGAAIGGAGVGAAGLGATRLGGVGIGTTGLATGSGTGAGLGYGANSGFAGAAGYGAGFSAGSALSGSSVNLAGNPFLNGGVSKYAGATTNLGVAGRPSSFPATSFESSIGSSVNLAKNPFLNGANIGQAQGGYNALSGSTNSQNFASTAGSKFSGLAGSGATAGANVNLIQTQQKVNEFDFDQQQQTQQNIGSFGIDGSSVGGGDLQQTCSGEGYACVIRSQCINGVVSGTGLLQASTKKQYCNLRTEICCRIQVVFNPQDTFSSGSDLSGVYRPVLKPGIPYLPPDNTNTGTNVVTSTLLPPRPIIVSTPRPFTSARPTYLPPVSSTSAPGYLPPIGEQTINRETIVPKPNYVDGSLILDQTRLPNRPKIPGPVVTEIPAGCAAALKCTPIEFCTSDGIISNTSIFLSQEQSAYRVPLTDCKDLATGRIGKCCRDPYYTDPWPTNQLGKWVPGVFGGNDGKYVPDSRGSGSGTPVVTARPFSTGGVILNDFIKPTTPIYQGTKGGSGQFSKGGSGQFTKGGKGQYGNAGQGQFVKQGQGAIIRPGQGVLVTPGGQGQVISQGIGTGVSQGFGQGVTNGGGTIIKEGGGQAIIPGIGTGISQGFGQGVASGGGAIIIPGEGQGILQGTGTGVSQGFGQGVVTGGGTIIREGEGQGILQGTGSSVSQGFGQGVITGGGTITKQGEGQGILQGTGSGVSQGFGQGVQTGEGQGVSQGFGQGVSQGFGQGVSQGLGQGVSQGFGQGFGQGISQGFGQGFSQGFGQGVAQGSGQGVSQGLGQGVTQGLGQGVIQGQGSLVSQGEGFGISQGFGQGVGQGEGSLVSQGGGLGVIEGQGGAVQQGFGQGVLQGQGSYVTTGQGQAISQGFGQGVSQGSGAYLSGGGGSLIRQGQGQAVSQGFGTGIRQSQGYTLAENEYSESRVQRVSLQPYKSGQQCGQLNSQRPFGNHNEQEVDFAEIPWQAMILEKTNKSLLCGGVITRPDVVITAAACVDGLDAQNVMIKGGEWKLGVDEEPLPFQIVQVKTIIVHPSYKPGTYHFDVAILVLSENLRFAKNIYPICLPSAQDDFEALYNGAGECIVTGWGKEILQSHLLGSIMHSLNVSLITPNECQAKINQDYPHLLEYYDQDSCVCGQPTNPLNNICSVDIGSALACTTGDGHYVLRGVYSWDSGCRQIGNQIGSFYKFDIEWYEWALGLIESVRFSQYTTGTIVTGGKGQFQIGGEGLAIKQGGGVITSQGQGFNIGSLFKPGTNTITYSEKITKTEPQIYSYTTKPEYITYTTKPEIITYTTKPKIISYTTKPEIITYTTKPEIVTYTTKPEYFTYTTKPKIVTYTTKPQIVTYTTKPKIVTYTTKPQFITYETSGSGTDPQYVAPGLSFKPSFSDILKPHKHSSTCQCEGKK